MSLFCMISVINVSGSTFNWLRGGDFAKMRAAAVFFKDTA
jgi:hypothetical protein